MMYKRNKIFQNMMFSEYNQSWLGNNSSASHQAASHHPVVPYFSITACLAVFYSLHNEIHIDVFAIANFILYNFTFRLMSSKWLDSIFQCCRHVHKSTCSMSRLVPAYKAAVLSFQLVLKMAEIQYEQDEDFEKNRPFKQALETTQKEFNQWKDNLLQKPLFQTSSLSYPEEIEVQQ